MGTCGKMNSLSYDFSLPAIYYNKVIAIRNSSMTSSSVIEPACCQQLPYTISIQVRQDNRELQINCTSVIMMTVEMPYYTTWNTLKQTCLQSLGLKGYIKNANWKLCSSRLLCSSHLLQGGSLNSPKNVNGLYVMLVCCLNISKGSQRHQLGSR